MDVDVDENILDDSILKSLFDGENSKILSIDDIIEELGNPQHAMMTTEEMDKYITDFLEENKGEQSPKALESKFQNKVCFLFINYINCILSL